MRALSSLLSSALHSLETLRFPCLLVLFHEQIEQIEQEQCSLNKLIRWLIADSLSRRSRFWAMIRQWKWIERCVISATIHFLSRYSFIKCGPKLVVLTSFLSRSSFSNEYLYVDELLRELIDSSSHLGHSTNGAPSQADCSGHDAARLPTAKRCAFAWAMAASNQHRACPRLLASHSKHVFSFFRYACIHVYVDVYCVYVFVYMSLYVNIYAYGVMYVLWHNCGARGRALG